MSKQLLLPSRKQLALPRRYFKRTLKYLVHLRTFSVDSFIKRYSLSGLHLLDTSINKVSLATHNITEDGHIKVFDTVKAFNNRIHSDSSNSFQIYYRKGSALIGRNIYNQLTGFVDHHFNIPHSLNDYIDRDAILADMFKRHQLTGFSLVDKNYVAFDVFEPRQQFTFSAKQLEDMATALFNNDQVEIAKFNHDTIIRAVQHDNHLYETRIVPALPLFMGYRTRRTYNKLIRRIKLVRYILDRLHH